MILDCIQLVEPKKRGEAADREMTEIARGLKDLAKEFRVAFVAVSTLNRGFERREDKRPRLTDLRGSGSIEDHADVVLFLHPQTREETWGADFDERSTTLIIAKHISSSTCDLNLDFTTERLRFEEQAEEAEA